MKTPLKSIAARIADHTHRVGAQFDPDVLQWPGGAVIALLLMFRAILMAALNDVLRSADVGTP
jgi:hypothetical protein